jgi:leader peptidase (prepilin peptidase)/N-methyltransferase
MQQMWSELAMMGMLTMCSAQDVKRKQIRLNLVLAFGILGILFHMLWRIQSMGSLLSGMAVGLVLLVLALLSGGRIGVGDGVLLIVTGIYLGLEENLELLFTGLFLCGLWALVLLVLKKKQRQDTIPFVPFLLVAYVGMLVGGL